MVVFIKKYRLIFKLFGSLFMFITISYLIIFYFQKHNYYLKKLNEKTNLIIEGSSAPRGRIYDVNGNILVDNIMTNNLTFHYIKGINIIDVAKKLASIITFDNPSENEIISWYINYDKANSEN